MNNIKLGIFVRSIGERTEKLCLESCNQQIDLQNVHLIKNYYPSYNAYKEMFKLAINSDYDWFLAVDADIILYENCLDIVKREIERLNKKNIFKFTNLVYDHIFRETIDRGNHVYNNAFSNYALKELKKNIVISKMPMFIKKNYQVGRYLKPETSIRNKLKKKYSIDNFNSMRTIGIHGTEQYLSEIFRRFATRSNRNPEYINKYDFLNDSNQEKLLRQGDIDRYVASLGWKYGLNHPLENVDARTLGCFKRILKETGIADRSELKKNLNWFYNEYYHYRCPSQTKL